MERVDQFLSLQVEVERLEITRRPHVNCCFLAWGEIDFELCNDVFGNFTLNRKHVRQIPIVMLCPKVRVRFGID